jgi:hypothetical protein
MTHHYWKMVDLFGDVMEDSSGDMIFICGPSGFKRNE